MMDHVYAVVLAGGSGTRFWPASRKARPKQLLGLAPGDDRALLRATIDRLRPLCDASRVHVATGLHLLEQARRLLAELPPENFLAEPYARNTAPCIAWASKLIALRDPEAILAVVPSDQYVGKPQAYHAALSEAIRSAAAGHITLLGIVPTRAETGYGYIEAEPAAQAAAETARPVRRFVEKPDQQTAAAYVASGNCFWNAGIFVFRARQMLDAIDAHLPALSPMLRELESALGHSPGAYQQWVERAFAGWPSVSIDYGVMEKLADLRVVPADIAWSDLGSWEVSWELAARDARENAGDAAVLIEAHGNLVRDFSSPAGKRLVALVGVNDLCVIQTDDALLILPRQQSQDVRLVVEQLRKSGRDDLL